MAIKAGFTRQDIANRLNQFHANLQEAIVVNLIALGEKCVNWAKDHHTYIDRTGNLTSSIGYIVIAKGRIVHRYMFEGNGEEGKKTGEAYIRKISGGHTNGYALIVVAGMQYATHVQKNGRDVLESAEIFAEKELPKLIKRIEKALKKMAK
ncbi:hypothetical protein [Aquirufa aurantiipilula]